MTKIEIDEEVLEYLKKFADPFIDTPNSVLRKIFHLDEKLSDPPKKSTTLSFSEMPKFDYSIPDALQQILELIYLTKIRQMNRVDATNYIAKKRGIAFQTVIDKYCRQLGLKANQVDDLLISDIKQFKIFIRRKHFNYNDFIDEFFNKYNLAEVQ